MCGKSHKAVPMVASFTIEALDNQFAVATGSNVGVSPGASRFDHPPNSTQDLRITTQNGDADPRLFEVGDVYDVAWTGSGAGSLQNAVVVRSDTAGGDSGIVVFEGTNQNGDPAHVIWTPDFDLENWYWTYYGPSNPPNFYITDQNAAYTHEYICFDAGTRLHTPRGLMRAGQVRAGDKLCTWGGTAREVLWTGRRTVPGTGAAAPVRFARETIGNYAPVKLSPLHRVMVASARADLSFAAPEVLVPAISLVNGRTIRQVSRETVTYVHLLLDRHDILIAEGAPCESLLPGRRTRLLLTPQEREAVARMVGDRSYTAARPVLSRREAMQAARDWTAIRRAPVTF